MNNICDKAQCTGCGLCAARCPKHCITMRAIGKLGHVYPVIDQGSCIDCGLCRKGCPSLVEIECRYPQKAYAAWSKDGDDYKSSTSGGAASVLTRHILDKGGVVYGCSVLPGIRIEHVRIDKIEDAARLKGSKYVQSSITGVLPSIHDDVKGGRQVLFIGTPCQVAAVKRMFMQQPDNLFLVDIICHGVPSNKWLADYISEYLKIDKDKVTSVKFRTTNAYQLCVYDGDRLLYQSRSLWQHRYEDLYMDTFIDGFTNRDSCFSCHYAKPERISDITIGDFWGLGEEVDDSNIPEHRYGVSCILPVTAKGAALVEAVKGSLNIYERPVTEAVNGNDQLRHPKATDWRIRLFRRLCGYAPIGFSYRMAVADKIMKNMIKKLIKR